jgi:nucleoside-diphosphate-sugar epimerase
MTVLILGGTRFLGRRVAELLLAEGLEVAVAHRGRTGTSPEGTATLQLDRATGAGLDAVRRLRPSAVIDLSGYEAAWVRDALEVVASGAAQYVFVSSGAVYRPSAELPWPETAPDGPMPIWGRYGHEKLAAERLLFAAHARGDVAATVLRFPFVMGPGNYADRESFVCSRILAGRPVLLPDGGSAVNQLVHVDDAARALVAAVTQRDRSAGEAFNCGYARGITNRGFVELCAAVLREPAEIVAIDAAALGADSAPFDLTDLVFPFPDEHYLLDCGRLRERLGLEARIGSRGIVEQFVATWTPTQPRRYEREERALAALRR